MEDNLIKPRILLLLMRREVVDKIIEYAKREEKPVSPKFHSSACKSLEFNSNNFHDINAGINNNLKNKAAFVDGGSCIIFNASDLTLSLIRACSIIFSNNKKISIKRNEFYLITRAMSKNDEIFYNAEIFSLGKNIFGKNIFSFNSLDRSLMAGNHRGDIARITDAIRRLAELRMAKEAVKNLEENDMVIMDGLLECDLNEEAGCMEELYKEGLNKKIIICAFSKENSIFSDTGESFASFLGRVSDFGAWYYHPVAEIKSRNHQAELFFAKLHKNSSRIFRFEIFKEQKPELNTIFSILANNSKDPVFLGYPYGLIEADKLARVSNDEADLLRSSLGIRLEKSQISSFNQRNAHNILDSISF